MGINGLLPLLKPVTKDMHISDLKGLTVGIDTYCWLHKSIYSCSAELCQGISTDKFIKYCVERVHLLLSNGIKPYLVFDGGYLPAKARKEAERRAKRQSNLQRGLQLTREGNASGAHQFFCKAADVTPFMAHQVIQVIKRIPGVRYVVAPYEADAQLGFLARNGHVDAVITEDSDIMLFGCSRVVFKLDRDGTGQEVDLREVFSRRNDELDMRGMDEDDLMILCALSGCDYLPSVHGMGLKKAHRIVSRHRQLPKILRAVRFDAAGAFPRGYEADFQRALLTFRHQRAFDPVSRSVVHMTPLPATLPTAILPAPNGNGDREADLDEVAAALAFLGPPVPRERGCAIADGQVDPITGEAFPEMTTEGAGSGGVKPAPESVLSEAAAAALTAWRGCSAPGAGRSSSSSRVAKRTQLSAQGNNLTKYWGAPFSSKKGRPNAVTGNGGVLSGRAADHNFGFDATPDRPRRRTVSHRGGGGPSGAMETTCGGRSHAPSKRDDPDNVSPLPSPTCVSPGSFYAGMSPAPAPPAAAASGNPFNDAGASFERDKENLAPRALPDEAPAREANDSPATSKFFGGGDGNGGGSGSDVDASCGGGKGPPVPQSGLRRRFRPPQAAARSAAASAVGSTLRRIRSSGCGGGGGGDEATDSNDDDTDPWVAGYAFSRQGVSRETSGIGKGSAGAGIRGLGTARRGDGGGGSRLKRRRTLGVGSLVPSGIIRRLEGLGSSGNAGPGRRRKSLGGAVGGGDDDVDSCVNNLFERFAARLHPPTRAAIDTCGGGGQPAPAETPATATATAEAVTTTVKEAETEVESLRQASGSGRAIGCKETDDAVVSKRVDTPGGGGAAAAAAARGAEVRGDDENNADGSDGGGALADDCNAQLPFSVSDAPLPPLARVNSRGDGVCMAGRISSAGEDTGGRSRGRRASSVGKSPGCVSRTTTGISSNDYRVATAGKCTRRSESGAGYHSPRRENTARGAVRAKKRDTWSFEGGGGLSSAMFDQFVYSPALQ